MKLHNYFSKLTTVDKSPVRVTFNFAVYSGIGGLIAIAVLALLTKNSGALFIMAPFGASCVLAFGVPESPLAQPRNIIGGHFVSSFIGIACYVWLGNEWYSLALGVGAAMLAMMVTKTVHPPAGADPLLIIISGVSWDFLLTPVLSGSIILVIIALVFNNAHKKRKYPKYWY